MIAGDRDRAGSDRGIDEARAVGLAAGQGEEEIAFLHHAAVDGEPGDGGRLGLRIEFRVDLCLVAEEVTKLHIVPVGVTRRKPAAGRSRRLRNSGRTRLTALLWMPQE